MTNPLYKVCPLCLEEMQRAVREIERLRRFAWWVECGDFESTSDLQRRAHEALAGAPAEPEKQT